MVATTTCINRWGSPWWDFLTQCGLIQTLRSSDRRVFLHLGLRGSLVKMGACNRHTSTLLKSG